MSAVPKRLSTRIQVIALNIVLFLAIVVFCLAAKANLTDFVFLLLGWHAMVGWTKVACGVFPTFDNMPLPVLCMIGYLGLVFVGTWCALDRLVMGNLPTAGAVFIFAYAAIPELVVQSHNPKSKAFSG